MHFTKMHGAGNDFIIIENLRGELTDDALPGLARTLCTEHTGIGADGLMVIVPALSGGDVRMIFLNRDGSRCEMCGNGARCICRYCRDRGFSGDIQRIETDSGTVIGERVTDTEYRVRLNDPSVLKPSMSVLGYDCGYAELGSPGLPHAVVMLDGWDEMPREKLCKLGSALRYAKEFPKGANVSFVKKLGENSFKAVTFERGVEDFTLACGTGCGSIAAITSLRGLASPGGISVAMPGGTLSVRLTVEGGSARDIFITGPTAVVFTGETKELSPA